MKRCRGNKIRIYRISRVHRMHVIIWMSNYCYYQSLRYSLVGSRTCDGRVTEITGHTVSSSRERQNPPLDYGASLLLYYRVARGGVAWRWSPTRVISIKRSTKDTRRQNRLRHRSSRVTSLNLRSYNSNKPPFHTASEGKHRRYPQDEPCSYLAVPFGAGSSPGKVPAGCSRRDKEPNCAMLYPSSSPPHDRYMSILAPCTISICSYHGPHASSYQNKNKYDHFFQL